MTKTPSTPRILVTHRVFPATAAMLAQVGRVMTPGRAESFSPAARRQQVRSADALLAFMPDRVDDAFLAGAPRLRIVAGALKGYDNFDAAACARRGIWLTIVPDLLTAPAAELTIGLMIALGRHVSAGDRLVRSGRHRGWRPNLYGRGLEGESVGIVGMGAIGKAIARRLTAFRSKLLYADPTALPKHEERRLGLTRLELSALLARSDYVVLATSLLSATTHLIDARRLATMKRGALLINPSRGSIVDETAVAAALASGQLGGYAADVFEMEDWHRHDRPRAVVRALREQPNTLFTPHLGSAVVATRQAIEERAAQNILDCFEGRTPRDAVAGPVEVVPPRRERRRA